MSRVILLLGVASVAAAQSLTTLASFNGANGANPFPLTIGTDGNLYGVTGFGGAMTEGEFFQVTPSGVLTPLYTFAADAAKDGFEPSAGLVRGADGNFYGTTLSGGTGTYDTGVIFKMTPSGVITTIYNWGTTVRSASTPLGGMILAKDGNFYGITNSGGASLQGTVFQLTPQGQFSLIYSFAGRTPDGGQPRFGVVQGPDGNFYGTTSVGGVNDYGTVFQITSTGVLKTLYSFPADVQAVSALIVGPDGNLYGTTSAGGSLGHASIFRMTLAGALTTIYSFDAAIVYQTSAAQLNAFASLILGADGNIYGTTPALDAVNGTIFKITTAGVFTNLYTFCTQTGCPDGSFPTGLIQAPDGTFYGTTQNGGANHDGTVFSFRVAKSNCASTAAPVIASIDSASAYGGYPYFASGSWLEIKGTNLAAGTGQWTSIDFNGPNAPTSLSGNSVSIDGKAAYVWYISPTQLNVQAPQDSSIGNVTITATNCFGTSTPITFARQALAPGLLAPSNYSANGTPYLVATFASDGAYVLNTATGVSFGLSSRPAKPGDVIIAYGVGFGDVTPAIPPGVIVQQSNQLVNPVTIQFGSASAAISYQGLAGNFVGLYEFFITVPPLPDGDYPITVQQNGIKLPQTMYLTIHN